MISDADLVDAMAALYAPSPSYQGVFTTDGVVWTTQHDRANNAELIIFRGSADWIPDGVRDLESEAARIIVGYPSIGHVPYGFGAGMLETYQAITKELNFTEELYVLGHSLGAARAAIFAGMLAADGHSVRKMVLCGCPRPGMQSLATVLAETLIHNYHNGEDPVPEVPVPLPPLLPWQDVRPMKKLNQKPVDASWHGLSVDNPMSWHNIALYQAGVRALGA